jgi:hypothetical protein
MTPSLPAIPGGWIKLYRCLAGHDLWLSEPFTRGQAWVDLLLMANHKSGQIRRRGIRVNVQRGEVGISLRELAARWQWSVGKVQRFFAELKTDDQIYYRMDTENVSVTTLICLTNYEKYQLADTETGTQTDTETGTEQECKEGKEEKPEKTAGDKPPAPSALADLWNSIVKEPKVLKVSKARETKCRLRLKERDVAGWMEVFKVVSREPFLRGENNRGWCADFDWIIANDTNALKVLEGKYSTTRSTPAIPAAAPCGDSAGEHPALPSRPRRAEANFAN